MAYLAVIFIISILAGTTFILFRRRNLLLESLAQKPLLLETNEVYKNKREILNLTKVFNDLGADGYALSIMEANGMLDVATLLLPDWERSQHFEEIFSLDNSYDNFIETNNNSISEIEARSQSQLHKQLPVAVMNQRVLDFQQLSKQQKQTSPLATTAIISPPNSDRTFVDLDAIAKFSFGYTIEETVYNVSKWWGQRTLRKLRDTLDSYLIEYTNLFMQHIASGEIYRATTEASRSWDNEIARLEALERGINQIKGKPLLAKYVVRNAIELARTTQDVVQKNESKFLADIVQKIHANKKLEAGYLIYLNRKLLFKYLPGVDTTLHHKIEDLYEQMRKELTRLDAKEAL